MESFLLSGRVTNVTSLIAFHPQYLECFLKTEYFMFKGEGPLPFDWRCYIAIMVRQSISTVHINFAHKVNSGQSGLLLNMLIFLCLFYRVQADIAAVIWYVMNKCAVSDTKSNLS